MKPLAQINWKQKGQSLVEFGFSLVILLIILAGIIDLGRLLFEYIAMRDAAEEGAVFGSLYPMSCNQIVERVRENLYISDPSQVEVTVTVNGKACETAAAVDACSSKNIDVKVHEPNFNISMPFLGSVIGSQTIDVNATMSGVIIRPPCP